MIAIGMASENINLESYPDEDEQVIKESWKQLAYLHIKNEE